MNMDFMTANTILYCREWQRTVAFYKDGLGLPVTMANDWFVEFRLTETARLSIADDRRSATKSCGSAGVTVTLQVSDIDKAWHEVVALGITPTSIVDHAWGARLFQLFDPDGHRVELWQPAPK